MWKNALIKNNFIFHIEIVELTLKRVTSFPCNIPLCSQIGDIQMASFCSEKFIHWLKNVYTYRMVDLVKFTFLLISACERKLKIKWAFITGLHTQKAYTHSSTSPMEIFLLLAHAYMHFAWILQLGTQCVHQKYTHWVANCNSH